MNLECGKRIFMAVYSRRLSNYLLKPSSAYNLGYIWLSSKREYFQPSTKLVEDSNPLKKIINLTEFVEQKHCSVLKKINDVLQAENISNFSKEQKKILFYSCGKLLSNRSLELRRRLCEEVFNKIKQCGELTVDDCNTYIQICTENEKEIDFGEFFKKIELKPNEETYKALLENACEMGNVTKAYEILAEMKTKKCTIDERVFNALILGNTIENGLRGSETVLATMRAAHVLDTSNTYWNILKGLVSRGNKKEFLQELSKASLVLDDGHFMQLLLKLGLNDAQDCLLAMKRKFKIEVIPRNLTHIFDHLCINLIHRAKAKAAIEIYCSLCEPNSDVRFLLEEIVKTDINSNNTIIEIANYLKAIEKNKEAFEDFYDISLRFGKPSLSWSLIEKLDRLRTHYFWPLILKAAEERGEIGVLDTLARMRNMNVEIDSDTLELYALPHCDLSDPRNLIERIQILELPLKVLLTPILNLLLHDNKIIEAYNLCNEFKVPVQGVRMIKSMVNVWVNSKDTKRCIKLLKRMSETNESSVDITGTVLLNISKMLSTSKDYKFFYNLVKDISPEKLVITSAMSELTQRILHTKINGKVLAEIEEALDSLVDISITGDKILHPRNMNLQELECHLIELQSKNKETRGVLRRLVQFYAKEGNDAKLNECLRQMKVSGYEISPGMKSSLLQSYIKCDNLGEALGTFEDLRRNHPDFSVDHYKVIDLATLMVKSNQFMEVMKFLNKELRTGFVRNPSLIERNCRELLSSCNDPTQASQILQLLREKGYCKPTNVILGSIVRLYLNRNDYDGAIRFYVQCSEEHKCTPLQLELIYAIIDIQDEIKLQNVINATACVHGVQNAQMALLAALAEKGMVASLNRLILDMKAVSDHLLQLRCKRWIKEGKVDALITLEKSVHRLPPKMLNVELIYNSIGQIYVNNNDCQGAVEYCKDLLEREMGIPKKLAEELDRLFTRNKFKIPKDLLPYVKT